MSSTVETATEIKPFHVELPEEGLDDLRRRIEATRWPSKELVDDRSQGVQLATLKALADYWASEYDFGRVAERLNALPQFVTEIDGIDVHFIHVRSEHEDALPLIMTHGWPGSVIELLETIEPLTAPDNAEDAFHVVLPSVPGYGFSSEPTELGWWAGRVAQIWPQLMQRLGYTRYVAQGGDVGAAITDAMARLAPEGLIGIHTNLLVTALGGAPQPTETDEERAAAKQGADFRQTGFGYFLEQATRPQTIGYALLDSPVALAAWMLDHDTDSYYKISGAFVDGKPTGGLTRDHILDNITLYWLTAPAPPPHAPTGRVDRPRQRPPLQARRLRGHGARGLHAVPGRDLPGSEELGRAGLPERHLLPQGRQGRPLRRLGGAGAVHRRIGRPARCADRMSRRPSSLPSRASRGHRQERGSSGWPEPQPADSDLHVIARNCGACRGENGRPHEQHRRGDHRGPLHRGRVPADQINDLRERIESTRWPSKELVDDSSQGVQPRPAQELAATGWRTTTSGASRRGSTPCRSTGPRSTASRSTSSTCARGTTDALPLIITHGWPGRSSRCWT